ncbi:hypothetical protein [Bdellovibrio bacteriovorus]|uniref:hypothetical protein n=1 Tax=Bdellovibrio TaxID=958 RepID=UPI0035A9A296
MRKLQSLFFLFLWCSALVILPSCSSLDSKTDRRIFDRIKTFQQPQEFQSPLEGAQKLYSILQRKDLSGNDRKYISAQLKEVLQDQEAIIKELATTGQLELQPGHSYEFNIESFCVDAGLQQPSIGDGMYLAEMPRD